MIPISGGARTDPTAVPALIMPIAVDRCCGGIHSATTLVAAGKAPPSPMPNRQRAANKEPEVHRETMQRAGPRPPQHNQNESPPCADNIQHASASCIQHRIRDQKRELQPGELLVAERDGPLNRRDSDRQGLTIKIADGDGRRHQRDEIPRRIDRAATASSVWRLSTWSPRRHHFRCIRDVACRGSPW